MLRTVNYVFCMLLAVAPTIAQVTTAQANNFRASAYENETRLKPSNVNAASFGKLFSRTVDGDVFAQPLYLPSLDIPGKGKRSVVFVATEHDSVYAFDLDAAPDSPLWKTSFLAADVSPVPAEDVRCPFISPEIGVTSTPVIDVSTGTLYVLARTRERNKYVQRLHALDVATGREKFGGPVLIQAAVPGSGPWSSGGQIHFDPLKENPRAALLLSGGHVYLTWGSSCDHGPYHGWIMAYDAHSLAQTAVLNLSPSGKLAGIWQSDAGPAADQDGDIFVAVGNGDFDAIPGGNGGNYGDSLLKLRLQDKDQIFSVLDYFTPFNQRQLRRADLDLGSQGPVLLPDQPGPHPHVVVVAGKEGKLYVIDRDQMGKYQTGSDRVIQTIQVTSAYGAAACWNRHVYFSDSSRVIRDFAVEKGLLVQKAATSPLASSVGIPSVSADGDMNGVLWVIETKEWNEFGANKPAILHAYDALDISHELYNSEQRTQRDRAGMTVRFATPTIADGRVLVGARGKLEVYGLR